MACRALLAALALCVALPALAQQPVYPSYPPPPPASGENAPHTSPDQSGQQGYPDQQQQTSPVPQKPSPYPPSNQQGQEQGPDQYGQPSGQPQPPYSQPQPYPQQSTPAYPPSGNSLSWVPQGMEALGRTAAFHTDFTFDRSMLQLASGVWEGPGDPALADAISRLDGISVHSSYMPGCWRLCGDSTPGWDGSTSSRLIPRPRAAPPISGSASATCVRPEQSCSSRARPT
jgi:hypothetical protein